MRRTAMVREGTESKLLLSSGWRGCQADWAAGGGSPLVSGGGQRWLAAALAALVLVLAGLVRLEGRPGPGPSAGLAPKGPPGIVWEAAGETRGGEPEMDYGDWVEKLLRAYETRVGERLHPADRGKVALKVNTRSGRGLSTPKELVRAVIAALKKRGFAPREILVADYSARKLRQAGFLSPQQVAGQTFAGSPVLAWDSGPHFDSEWFYDSPLPPSSGRGRSLGSPVDTSGSEIAGEPPLEEGSSDRKSYLPMPLLFEVDFWINLAVGGHDPALGVDGALANATLWNVSNSRRFLTNEATASAAVAEIAAIPELEERMVLHFIPFEQYQFIGGPDYRSLYSRSEPRLWLSGDPVALDRLLLKKMNRQRVFQGFGELSPVPRQLPYAASLGLGISELDRIQVIDADGVE